ncbi:MAG: hypothetical protein ACRDH5_19720 [bacterium]
MIQVEVDVADRDMLLLALAITARLRPGFDHYLRGIAVRLGDADAAAFEAFKATAPETR